MCLSSPVLIIPSASNIRGTVVDLKFQIIFNFYLLLMANFFPIYLNLLSFNRVCVTTSLLRCPGLFSADFNNAVVWMVSILPLIYNSSSLSSRPSATIITNVTVIYMFHSILNSLARSWYFSTFLLLIIFTL